MVDRKVLPVVIVTGFWAVIGIVLPIIVQFLMKGSPNKGYSVIYLFFSFCVTYFGQILRLHRTVHLLFTNTNVTIKPNVSKSCDQNLVQKDHSTSDADDDSFLVLLILVVSFPASVESFTRTRNGNQSYSLYTRGMVRVDSRKMMYRCVLRILENSMDKLL